MAIDQLNMLIIIKGKTKEFIMGIKSKFISLKDYRQNRRIKQSAKVLRKINQDNDRAEESSKISKPLFYHILNNTNLTWSYVFNKCCNEEYLDDFHDNFEYNLRKIIDEHEINLDELETPDEEVMKKFLAS